MKCKNCPAEIEWLDHPFGPLSKPGYFHRIERSWPAKVSIYHVRSCPNPYHSPIAEPLDEQ